MGIDIYAKWHRMTKAEREAQFTGCDPTAGSVGYLREAYHGEPYATRALVPESFAAKRQTAFISAATLRARLPSVITLVLAREAQVYGNADARQFLAEALGVETSLYTSPQESGIEDLLPMLQRIFTIEIPKAKGPQAALPALSLEQMQAAALRFDVARSFLAFVELVERKEKETGRRVQIHASY